ncbi:hypothetical protein HanRHA438_Chr11g0483721 [Helianthus annuus]|nr:hypothetical protein HanXRQr2_Chr11g0470141 [Helianthus annuus]KAJ0868940.1 hypothetical protein HanRHA438_Chr11g0483721 [Helianthus annuus]KAJ0873517.1 hypothetical protein HanPSC8_Chr11g0453401 [Helianthus annuus]
MSISIPSFVCAMILPLQKEHKMRSCLNIRAQSFKDEGRWSNLVDSNMKLLEYRIEVIRTKERLKRNHRPCEWDNTSEYLNQSPVKQPEYLQTIALICGLPSLTILIGTTLLFIFAIIVHLGI